MAIPRNFLRLVSLSSEITYLQSKQVQTDKQTNKLQ